MSQVHEYGNTGVVDPRKREQELFTDPDPETAPLFAKSCDHIVNTVRYGHGSSELRLIPYIPYKFLKYIGRYLPMYSTG